MNFLYRRICNFILRDSRDRLYELRLEVNNKLVCYEKLNESVTKLLDIDNVRDYYAAIDSYDKIHIVYVTINNTLKYKPLNSMLEEKVISSTKNLNSILIHPYIYLYNDYVHVVYVTYIKKFPYFGKIHYLCRKDNTWENSPIGSVAINSNNIFQISTYKNYIYMFYNSYKEGYIIQKLNLEFNTWCQVEKNMISNLINPYFFINHLGIASIYFSSDIDGKKQILMRYRDLNIQNSKWSSSISLLSVTSMENNFFILTNNVYNFIISIEENFIIYTTSVYGTNDWSQINKIELKDKLKRCIYLSNNKSDKNIKSNFTFYDSNSLVALISTSHLNRFNYIFSKCNINIDSILYPHKNKSKEKEIAKLEIQLKELRIELLKKDEYISRLQNALDSKEETISKLILELNNASKALIEKLYIIDDIKSKYTDSKKDSKFKEKFWVFKIFKRKGR